MSKTAKRMVLSLSLALLVVVLGAPANAQHLTGTLDVLAADALSQSGLVRG